jgi:hypothetical protein
MCSKLATKYRCYKCHFSSEVIILLLFYDIYITSDNTLYRDLWLMNLKGFERKRFWSNLSATLKYSRTDWVKPINTWARHELRIRTEVNRLTGVISTVWPTVDTLESIHIYEECRLLGCYAVWLLYDIPQNGILHSHLHKNLKSYLALTGWAL